MMFGKGDIGMGKFKPLWNTRLDTPHFMSELGIYTPHYLNLDNQAQNRFLLSRPLSLAGLSGLT